MFLSLSLEEQAFTLLRGRADINTVALRFIPTTDLSLDHLPLLLSLPTTLRCRACKFFPSSVHATSLDLIERLQLLSTSLHPMTTLPSLIGAADLSLRLPLRVAPPAHMNGSYQTPPLWSSIIAALAFQPTNLIQTIVVW
jgi:hypothetical protein